MLQNDNWVDGSFIFFIFYFFVFVPVPVGLCHAGGRAGAVGRRQAAAGPQPAEGKHSGAAQPATGGGEPEAESGAAAHHFRVNTHTTHNNNPLSQLGVA